MTDPLLHGGSDVCRWQLGVRLRELREAAGKLPADVTRAHLGSAAKISKTENGLQSSTVPDVREWCRFYGTSAQVMEELVQLALGTVQQDWTEGAAVPEWFRLYVGLERSASSVHIFEPWLVAGLVQTEPYARAMMGALSRGVQLERRVRFRMARQRAARNVTAIIGESALHVAVGGAEVLAEQVEHLRGLAEVEVRVFPFSAGRPASTASFSLLDFGGQNPSCVYVETDVGRYSGKADDWMVYRDRWDELLAGSVPMGEWNR